MYITQYIIKISNTVNLYNQFCFVFWFNKNCITIFNKGNKEGDVNKIWFQFLNLKKYSVEFHVQYIKSEKAPIATVIIKVHGYVLYETMCTGLYTVQSHYR